MNVSRNRQLFAFVLFLLTAVVGMQMALPLTVWSQLSQDDWSDPLRLSVSPGFLSNARIVAGWDGRLHVFWADDPAARGDLGKAEGILYTRWDGVRWLEPANILVAPPGGEIANFSVVLDEEERFHLLMVESESTTTRAGSRQR